MSCFDNDCSHFRQFVRVALGFIDSVSSDQARPVFSLNAFSRNDVPNCPIGISPEHRYPLNVVRLQCFQESFLHLGPTSLAQTGWSEDTLPGEIAVAVTEHSRNFLPRSLISSYPTLDD